MSASLDSLDAMIAKIKRLGTLPDVVAKRAAPRVLAAIRKTANAGTTPDGKPWPPKKDGGRALEHAADHLSASADGSVITVTLTGKAEVVHNYGDHRNPKRQILPDAGAGLPKIVEDATRLAAAEVYTEILR
jgi:hypothetical protein